MARDTGVDASRVGVPVRLRRRAPVPVWPHQLLDATARASAGWRPQPFRQFVLKIHGRCNLACDYCYVYRSADQTWRRRPARMSEAVIARVAERIAEHARTHTLPEVSVVLHGGEPLLAGPATVSRVAVGLRSALPTRTRLSLSMQTNGTLLDGAFLDVPDRHDIRLGVSLDGLPAANDSRRHRNGGGGSHGSVVAALERLRSDRYRHLYAGLLAVVNVWTDPVSTYEHLLEHEPPAIDLLLPHANWSSRPDLGPRAGRTPYGDWLVALFDRWYTAPSRETSVRLFEEIIRMTFGRPGRIETVGVSPACHLVIETDGAIEHVDALKSAYEGAAATGLNVHDHAFDAALTDPQVVARQLGLAGLSPACRDCGIRAVCGGGYYPHRYDHRSGFLNPSVYCDDLARLIRHIQGRVSEDLVAARGERRP